MKCCVPGCETTTLQRRYPFCTVHYKMYGRTKPRPEWVRELIREYDRDKFEVSSRAAHPPPYSIEGLIEDGTLSWDELSPIEPHPQATRRSPGRKPRPKQAPPVYIVRRVEEGFWHDEATYMELGQAILAAQALDELWGAAPYYRLGPGGMTRVDNPHAEVIERHTAWERLVYPFTVVVEAEKTQEGE